MPAKLRIAVLACVVVSSGLGMGCMGGKSPTSVVPPPAPSADTVAFDMQAADRGDRRDIYTEALDGTGLVRLTSDSADHHAPSAGKSAVFFGSTRTIGNVVARVARSGGATSDLAAALGSADAPSLSPSGSTLAYLSMAPLARVWTANADGSNAQRFAAADAGWTGAVEGHPVWSPTGDRIAYVSTRSGNPGIYVGALNGATGSATLVTSSASGASVEPAWSPDGTRLVFTSNRDGPTDLYVVTVATRTVARLTSMDHVGQPTWLPDGRIVFTQWVGRVAGLLWLEPTAPKTIHSIATPGDAQHAASNQQ
jgi:Tol biopolymer transport system component